MKSTAKSKTKRIVRRRELTRKENIVIGAQMKIAAELIDAGLGGANMLDLAEHIISFKPKKR